MDAVLGSVAIDDGAVEILQVVQNSGDEYRTGRLADAALLRRDGDFQGFSFMVAVYCVNELADR
ncbi:MAG: hypothetical protein ACLR8Y_10545 [Alistipes indistinctus]